MRWNVSSFMAAGICGLVLVGGTVAIARQQQNGAPPARQTGDSKLAWYRRLPEQHKRRQLLRQKIRSKQWWRDWIWKNIRPQSKD